MAKRQRRPGTASDIRAIRKSLLSIVETLVGALAAVGEASATPFAGKPTRPRPRARLAPARRKELQLQGRYMALVRALKPRQKAQVRALRSAKGIQPAISLAARLAKA